MLKLKAASAAKKTVCSSYLHLQEQKGLNFILKKCGAFAAGSEVDSRYIK